MRHVNGFVGGLLVLAAAVAAGQGSGVPRQHAQKPQTANRQARESRGERVFNQNCARCHNPPEGFPPGISGTIARHMRVRAGLSEQDYKALLKYLNP